MAARVIKNTFRQQLIQTDKRLRAELHGALEITARELKTDHENAVSDWKHKPRFLIRKVIKKDRLDYWVGADRRRKKEALIWLWVDEGTRPHKIRAKNAPMLRFQTGYSARTAPVALAHVGDGQAHGDWRSKQEVNHPGTDAREFTVTFRRKTEPKFRKRVENALRRAVRRA